LRKEINTYEPTDVNYHGGMNYGSNIHAVSVQINQYIWDMIKILNQNNLYGFDFQAKIGHKKTIVILRHKKPKMLDKARKLLKYYHNNSSFIFLIKTKEVKSDKTVWLLLSLIISMALLAWLLFFMYDKELIFAPHRDKRILSKIEKNDSLHIQEIEIDIEKLNALKDTFSEQNNSIDEPIMKMMEVSTSVISSFISEEEKSKYSAKNLVESFNGKSGIKFVLKDENLSSDFNATVKELNSYAQSFINDNNISMALKCYDKALKIDSNQSTKDEILTTLVNQSGLYEEIGEMLNIKKSYDKIFQLSSELVEEDFLKYGFTKAWSLIKLSELNQEIDSTPIDDKGLEKAKKIYQALLIELRKKALDGKIVNQKILAWSLNFLADFYAKDKEEYAVSIEMRREALSIYKKLTKKEPKKYRLLYYKTLNSLAKGYLKNHQLLLATQSYTKGFSLSKHLSVKYKALSLSALGMVEIANKDFDRANRYYKNALKIYKKNPNLYKVDMINMGSLFAGLEAKKGNSELAKVRYKQVILAYKKMNREKPLHYNLEIAKVLNKLASLNFSISKNFLEAEIKVFEAISLCEKSEKIEHKEAQRLQVESYRYLAYLATLEQNMPTALEHYKKATSLQRLKL
jgi:tetratricopeptide (TPR) repeat protein